MVFPSRVVKRVEGDPHHAGLQTELVRAPQQLGGGRRRVGHAHATEGYVAIAVHPDASVGHASHEEDEPLWKVHVPGFRALDVQIVATAVIPVVTTIATTARAREMRASSERREGFERD
jgi:hypothetical protein